MRIISLIAALSLAACGVPDAASESSEATSITTGTAARGGVMVTLGDPLGDPLGDQRGELVVHASGELHFHSAAGKSDAMDVGVSVTLRDADDETHTVALRWADPIQGFVGQLEATPVEGEAEVLLVAGGLRSVATVEVHRLLPMGPNDGSVVAVGDRVVEVRVDENGEARLLVLDSLDAPLDIDVTLSVSGDDGRLHPLTLRWDEHETDYRGTIEGLDPRVGPLEVIIGEDSVDTVGRGSLLAIGPGAVEIEDELPSEFRLDLPELGSNVPAVIPIGAAPAPEEAPAD